MDLLQAIVDAERRAQRNGQIITERQEALDRYYGRPYGDEQEGRSQVVMRDVADTVEWIKPSLLKIFCSGDEVVRFEPIGPEDEEAAQQETDYVNHLLMNKSAGFIVLHDWFHDALTQRNGYVWTRAVKKTRQEHEQYQHLTEDELSLLLQGGDVEVLEHRSSIDDLGTVYHDVAVRCMREYTCLETCNVPPERVVVHADWPAVPLSDCPFVEVLDWRAVSELRQMGYDVPDSINDTAQIDDGEQTQLVRRVQEDQFRIRDDEHDEKRQLRVRYVWIRHDEDGDGIAELIHAVVVGDTILEQGEDDLIPVACLTPFRVPHEHQGMSVDDLVQDLQRIRTVLVRGFLDNQYQAMYPQTYVDQNRVNIDDLLVTRAGGVRRVNGNPGEAVMERAFPNVGGQLLQAVEYIDTVRENRTGVTRYNQGLDADSLNKTAHGLNQIMTASQQRIELIARVFAETGVKTLMLILHAMSIKHGRQQEMVRIRNKWVPIDPRGWKTRADLSIAVGIGTGNKDQMLQHLFMILQEQKQGMAMGLATPLNVYNTLKRISQNAGFKSGEEFWADPQQQQPQQPQPPIELMLEDKRIQADAQKTAMVEQNKVRIKMLELAADVLKTQAQAGMLPQMDLGQMAMQIDQMAGQMGPM